MSFKQEIVYCKRYSNMKKNLILCFIVCLCAVVNVSGQTYNYVESDESKEKRLAELKKEKEEKEGEEDTPVSLKDKIFVGGGFGLLFGNVTNINISPLVGYKVTPEFHVGVGASYTYLKDNRIVPPVSAHIVGGRIFSRYIIAVSDELNIYPQLEYEVERYEVKDDMGTIGEPRWFEYTQAGMGVYQQFGRRAGIGFVILYNLGYDVNESYDASPWTYRMEFNF